LTNHVVHYQNIEDAFDEEKTKDKPRVLVKRT